jgi:Family of unknown function (DUF6600)
MAILSQRLFFIATDYERRFIMSKKLLRLGMMVLLLLAIGAVKARSMEVNVSFFYNELAPYGEWISFDPYGWVWSPYNTGPGWRPYTDGYWAYSDFGWTFISPVDWGWACYHYGRWAFTMDYGWIWVPGTVWGPSWVAWRFGDDYIGWAPLPPEVGWSFGIGLELGGFDLDYGIHGDSWCFIEASRFMDPHIGRYLINPARNVTLMRLTKNVTNYTVANNRIVNNNINVSQWEKLTGRKVIQYRIVEPQAAGKTRTPRMKGTEIEMFRPAISSQKPAAEPKNALTPRAGIQTEEMLKRQKGEKDQLNSHYDGNLKELKKHHQQETAHPPKGISQEELNKRHQEEIQALQEQRRRETQALENRHRREQEQNQAQPRSGEASRQQGKTKPHK